MPINDTPICLTQLRRRLAVFHDNGWQAVNVGGDGNCFFRALAKQVYSDEQEHGRARQETIQYMRERREEFEHFVPKDFDSYDSYVNHMSREGTYIEGQFEIQAAADAFNVHIMVYGRSRDHDRTFTPLMSNLETRDVYMAHYQAAQHYVVLERMDPAPTARGAPAWSAANDAQIAAHQERERARAALDERRKASTNLDPAASPQNATRLAELKAELTQAIEAQDYATAAELASQMNAAVVAPRNPTAAGPLPDGWQELKTAEGKAYYYQKATKKTQWRRPVEAPLPDGWQELKTAEGKAYYYQKATKKTQWRRPVEAPADKAAATSKPVARASNRQVNAAIDSAT
eukprot:jgi/Chrpa1/20269/Chrysochromulina_OHIO_Genome00027367-RA